MRISLIITLVAALACKDDPIEPRSNGPSRSALNGSFSCVGFKAFYSGADGLGYYRGSCRNYLTISAAARADSIETFPFSIGVNNVVNRPGFRGGAGVLQYNEVAGTATITYPGQPTDNFHVTSEGVSIFLEQTRLFDFSGDGRADSLFLTFLKTQT